MNVKKIAQLARIELSQEEEKQFKKDFKQILEYLALLNKVDTTKIELNKGSFSNQANVTREDKIKKNHYHSQKLLKFLDSKKDNCVKVKSILKAKM